MRPWKSLKTKFRDMRKEPSSWGFTLLNLVLTIVIIAGIIAVMAPKWIVNPTLYVREVGVNACNIMRRIDQKPQTDQTNWWKMEFHAWEQTGTLNTVNYDDHLVENSIVLYELKAGETLPFAPAEWEIRDVFPLARSGGIDYNVGFSQSTTYHTNLPTYTLGGQTVPYLIAVRGTGRFIDDAGDVIVDATLRVENLANTAINFEIPIAGDTGAVCADGGIFVPGVTDTDSDSDVDLDTDGDADTDVDTDSDSDPPEFDGGDDPPTCTCESACIRKDICAAAGGSAMSGCGAWGESKVMCCLPCPEFADTDSDADTDVDADADADADADTDADPPEESDPDADGDGGGPCMYWCHYAPHFMVCDQPPGTFIPPYDIPEGAPCPTMRSACGDPDLTDSDPTCFGVHQDFYCHVEPAIKALCQPECDATGNCYGAGDCRATGAPYFAPCFSCVGGGCVVV